MTFYELTQDFEPLLAARDALMDRRVHRSGTRESSDASVQRNSGEFRYKRLIFQLATKPRTRKRPFAIGGGARQAEVLPRVLDRQAAKGVQLHELGRLCIRCRQPGQRLVQGQQVVG